MVKCLSESQYFFKKYLQWQTVNNFNFRVQLLIFHLAGCFFFFFKFICLKHWCRAGSFKKLVNCNYVMLQASCALEVTGGLVPWFESKSIQIHGSGLKSGSVIE